MGGFCKGRNGRGLRILGARFEQKKSVLLVSFWGPSEVPFVKKEVPFFSFGVPLGSRLGPIFAKRQALGARVARSVAKERADTLYLYVRWCAVGILEAHRMALAGSKTWKDF